MGIQNRGIGMQININPTQGNNPKLGHYEVLRSDLQIKKLSK